MTLGNLCHHNFKFGEKPWRYNKVYNTQWRNIHCARHLMAINPTTHIFIVFFKQYANFFDFDQL